MSDLANKKLLQPYRREKEEEIKRFWEKKKIPDSVRRQSAKQKKPFYFMDGPPYATGHVHMGTALNKILKDVAIRSKRMQGYCVFDRPGYDTHGLPIENKVEQLLGFTGKKDIEKYGVKPFVEECKKFATQFIDVMNAEFLDLGIWMDWENPYLTLTDDYIEAIWWTFKMAHEQNLLYLGKYPVHVCPHCETAVAYNEIEYVKQTDTSIFAKFPVAGKENTFLVVWTTTPWTLPGNTGVMVHPRFDYAQIALSNGEHWIVAKDLVQKLMDVAEAGYTLEREFKGKEMEGWRYTLPIAKNLKMPEMPTAYRVILNERYVNLEDGTGLVHTAPGHGKEDFDAGTKAGLPALTPVAIDGTLTEEAGKYAGKKAREVDAEIISDLEAEGALVYKHPYTHDYPVCWRCKSPLLMLGMQQWFFKISAIQKRLVELNKETKWVPRYMQDRMHNWLEQLGDWPISRARYWGTPLPIWRCEKCGEIKVIGSVKELEKESGKKKVDLHKPEIDSVELRCKCGSAMRRIPEVLDVWFDSGVSSWAALGYPREKKLFERFWPATLNLEGPDQFRGWWNSQLILSTIAFNKKPFESILVHGLITDLDKIKMSKSRGNAVTPREVMEKHNRDALRFYLVGKSTGEDVAFDWNSFKDISRFFNTLWNSCNYASMYLQLDMRKAGKISAKGLAVEDRWIISKTNSLAGAVLEAFNSYNFYKATAGLDNFVLEELSRTYIKLIRGKADTPQGKKQVGKTMSYVLDSLLRLLAPITPHFSEYIFQHLRSAKMPASVHLLQLPAADKKLVDAELEKEMEKAKEISQAVLSLREEQKKRLRWPLRELVLVTKTGKEFRKALPVIQTTANVKKIREATAKPAAREFAEKQCGEVLILLDVSADQALKDEWEFEELRRRVQEKRKEAKLQPGQEARLLVECSDPGFIVRFKKQLEKETNTIVLQGKGNMEKLLDREFFVEVKESGKSGKK
ncbi:MAG: isoleucine--tRNA ligase [Candidatus Diapherotrites archaeon]|nr:isoleucine--tRNA ligase [Candidatus Diapherotrites archaeon]